jgi:hypothetical protein
MLRREKSKKHMTQTKAGSRMVKAELTWDEMNRQQRRAYKSKKQGQYVGLKRPTDNGRLNSSRKSGKPQGK